MWFICFIVVEVIMFFVPMPRAIAIERGLDFFFTGVPCKYGDNSPRVTKNSKCTGENCYKVALQKSKDHYLMNRDKVLAELKIKNQLPETKLKIKVKNKKYREENQDKLKAYEKARSATKRSTPEQQRQRVAKYRLKHRERLLVENKEAYWKNPERYRKASRLSNRKHIVKRLASTKEWSKNNPEKVRATNNKYRAIKLSSYFSNELTDFVLEEASALSILRATLTGFKWHVDHMIPLQARSVCGLHVWNNLQSIPQTINNSKRNKLIYTNPHEWLYDIPKFFKVVHQQEIAA